MNVITFGVAGEALSGPQNPVPHHPTVNAPEGRQYVAPSVESHRVVQKPVSRTQLEDPREFQIRQLRRRFSPIEKAEDGGTSFTFQMVPSDPDFPFEMVGLDCVLHVPVTYPEGGTPSLDVRNKAMGRGYQINVERGFARLAQASPQTTLLGLMNSLDKQLEALLTEPKAETVKFMPNVVAAGNRGRELNADQNSPSTVAAVAQPVVEEHKPPQVHTSEQKNVAEARRATETRQLEARLGRLPLFFKSPDGIAYTVPVQPRKAGDLPVPLQAVKTIKLFVPMLYPLEQCRVEILGVTREAASSTEKGFEQKARENPMRSLMGHVNYLAQDMHVLATQPTEEPTLEKTDIPDITSLEIQGSLATSEPPAKLFEAKDDRSHIKVIPRPPEWALRDEDNDDSDDSDDYDSEDEVTVEMDEENALRANSESAATVLERGILLSFPFLELHGIEILELVSLCITVKCDRCKDTLDVSNLRTDVQANGSGVRLESCKKCANPFQIGTATWVSQIHPTRTHQQCSISTRANARQFRPGRIFGP